MADLADGAPKLLKLGVIADLMDTGVVKSASLEAVSAKDLIVRFRVGDEEVVLANPDGTVKKVKSMDGATELLSKLGIVQFTVKSAYWKPRYYDCNQRANERRRAAKGAPGATTKAQPKEQHVVSP
jgi:hypothetical protein